MILPFLSEGGRKCLYLITYSVYLWLYSVKHETKELSDEEKSSILTCYLIMHHSTVQLNAMSVVEHWLEQA